MNRHWSREENEHILNSSQYPWCRPQTEHVIMQCWGINAQVMHERTPDGLVEARGLGLLLTAALWLAGALRLGLALARGLMLEDTLGL